MLSCEKRASFLRVILLSFLAAPALAQDLDRDDLRSQPYLYGSVGGFTSGAGGGVTYGFGGGADWLVYGGLGLGVDATIFGSNAYGFFVGSFDVSYHIIPSSSRIVPFVVGGIGFGGESGSESSVAIANFGGGVNLWTGNGMALRIEVRAHVPVEGGDTHVGARVGLTF